ncbi:unnamed protein product [Meganyctiphanes norvegica]|uniref:HTH CENPB-type domain-containing protein n=3 Tax=Meganyctiphanes norvegica TaxID=48144 RepID=A0AAV2RNS5_MEGNR
MATMTDNAIIKRKHRTLSIAEKVKLCDLKKAGRSNKNLAIQFNIGLQTTRDIIKKDAELRKFVSDSQTERGLFIKKNISKGRYPQLDECLFQWFLQRRAENVPMSGSMLMCKAKWYCEKLGITDLNCSLGFLHR